MNTTVRTNGYNVGHPWYYVLGGQVQFPKQIREDAITRGYHGYLADELNEADKRPEPGRSITLRKIRGKVLADFQRDLSCYRKLACELRHYRREQELQADHSIDCADIHVNISLKYSHLYNDLAHLNRLDTLLSLQPDLFGF